MYNYIFSFVFITIIILSITCFYNAKSVENCILVMKFQRENENPGPDLITFKISSDSDLFESNIDQYGLVEVVIDAKKTFKTKMFKISKTGENQYELNVSSPYFTYKTDYSEEQVYSFFNNKGFTINITLDDKKFVFVKC